jgi:hypothetical protein
MKVTFFRNAYAKTLTFKELTLEQLRDLVATTTADDKKKLPWLKLAKFGDQRSADGSLRNNSNLLQISGIEGDYDGEQITVDKAAHILKRARLQALVYTSPSHSLAKPRWRVLCPTSKPLPPERREGLVARLNGLFSGVLAQESFTLSQAYYFGSVRNNPAHSTVIVAGEPIDLRGQGA